MDYESEFHCVYVYTVDDYIQFVKIGTSEIVAFSTDVKYSRAARGVAPPTPPSAVVPQELQLTSSGSGFVVSTETFVLTNAHVVEGCQEVRIRTKDRSVVAIIASQDVKNDLALLRLPPEAQPIAVFQESNTLYPGDSVVALGFPLRGVLASEANVSVGTVSALAGLRNDTSKLQISAPIQPGNSGGPLFDKSGLVVGVIVSSLDDKVAMEVLGVIPQNVNFAIKSQAAMALMRASDVRFTQRRSTAQMAAAEIARNARQFTVPIECWG